MAKSLVEPEGIYPSGVVFPALSRVFTVSLRVPSPSRQAHPAFSALSSSAFWPVPGLGLHRRNLAAAVPEHLFHSADFPQDILFPAWGFTTIVTFIVFLIFFCTFLKKGTQNGFPAESIPGFLFRGVLRTGEQHPRVMGAASRYSAPGSTRWAIRSAQAPIPSFTAVQYHMIPIFSFQARFVFAW